ncbi:MAG: hypothetical protein LBR26_09995 [Prevotella sp.]|nr:hypothetical protein [Prevotella sp.]
MAEKLLSSVFRIVWRGLSVAAFKYKRSLLPVTGIFAGLYLMTERGGWIGSWLQSDR